MELIPVIDLKGGAVVHARGGARGDYAPIATPLAQGSAPADVLTGLARAVPFRSVYVADLDAIERRGSHAAALADLAAGFPLFRFWVDPGLDAADALAWLGAEQHVLVLGSESQRAAAALRDVRGHDRCVLSLDFRGDTFIGPHDILEDASLWPARVIVMTLARVGGGGGPDVQRLAEVVARAEGRAVYAAGGVRDARDLRTLAEIGVAGALVATALHSGAITARSLEVDGPSLAE
jgi:phosphoribosylformimino-5-aminoimidazole carboxamide ribotide isomerase